MPKGSNDVRDYPHVDLLFPSDYITAADLLGRDVTITIEAIEPRHELQRQSGKDYRPVIRMRGKAKKWVLNKTNAKTIAKLYGPEVQGWIGKRVTIYPTRTRFGPDEVDAIRVRPRVPSDQEPAPAPAPAQSRPRSHPETAPQQPATLPPPDDEPAPNSPEDVGFRGSAGE